jgi:hypothetical protein
MGLYINPPGMTKEKFLQNHAERVTEDRVKEFNFDPMLGHTLQLPLCLVDNGHFTALAVGFEKEETLRWFNPQDFRPKRFYFVAKEVIKQRHLSGITEAEYKEYVEGGQQ